MRGRASTGGPRRLHTGTGSITVLRSRGAEPDPRDPSGALTAAARGRRARPTMNKEY